MHTDNPNHGPALYLMNNGSMSMRRPCMGAWLSYGLGTDNADLPGHVVLCPGPPGGCAELGPAAVLRGEHQGTYINPSVMELDRLTPFLRGGSAADTQLRQIALLRKLNEERAAVTGPDAALEARIKAMET